MKIVLTRDTGIMSVDGKSLNVDTSTLALNIEILEFDTVKNTGMVQFQEDVMTAAEERDLEAEAERNRILRESNKPESEEPLYKGILVHRSPETITSWLELNYYLELFEAAKTPPPPPEKTPAQLAEEVRVVELVTQTDGFSVGSVTPKTLKQIGQMTWAQYDTWFTSNFTTQAMLIRLLKLLLLYLARRVR